MYINKVTLLGNLGNDPKIIQSKTNSGFFVTFSLATNRLGSQQEQIAEWHNVIIFPQNLAEYAKAALKKGDLVYIEGGIRYEQYKNKNGDIVSSTKIIVASTQPSLLKINKAKNDNIPTPLPYKINGGMQC